MTSSKRNQLHVERAQHTRADCVVQAAKGLLLLAVGVGAVKLLPVICTDHADWVDFLRVDPDNASFTASRPLA